LLDDAGGGGRCGRPGEGLGGPPGIALPPVNVEARRCLAHGSHAPRTRVSRAGSTPSAGGRAPAWSIARRVLRCKLMPPHALGSGTISFGLVSLPVQMDTAAGSEGASFHLPP